MNEPTQEFRTPTFKTADYLSVARGYFHCSTVDPARWLVVVGTKSGAMHAIYEGSHEAVVSLRNALSTEDGETWAG